MALSPKATIIACAGALVAWIAVLLGTLQIAYMRDAYSLLDHDITLALGALAGCAGTIFFIFTRSRLSVSGRLILAAACLSAFICLTFWGALSVACANGNCL